MTVIICARARQVSEYRNARIVLAGRPETCARTHVDSTHQHAIATTVRGAYFVLVSGLVSIKDTVNSITANKLL